MNALERLEALTERLTADVNARTDHGRRSWETLSEHAADLMRIERELIEIITALKEVPK